MSFFYYDDDYCAVMLSTRAVPDASVATKTTRLETSI